MRTKIVAVILAVIAVFFAYSRLHGEIPRSRQNAQQMEAAGGKQDDVGEKAQTAKETGQPDIAPIPKDPVTSTNDSKAEERSAVPVPSKPVTLPEPTQEPAAKPKEEATVDAPQIPVPDVVEQKAASIAKKEVETADFMKAAGVILGKLSFSEIKFLFDTASDDFWVTTPVEEIEKVRSIIFKKLTPEDLNTLRLLGKKYGRSMTILEPDIDVAKTKEKQVEEKKAKK